MTQHPEPCILECVFLFGAGPMVHMSQVSPVAAICMRMCLAAEVCVAVLSFPWSGERSQGTRSFFIPCGGTWHLEAMSLTEA